MKMAKVKECNAADCSYNSDMKCHAMAITIGDATNPMCDTFCQSSEKGGDSKTMAMVGACKVSSCMHNNKLECDCSEIQMGQQGSEVDCLSFSAE